MNRSKPFQPPKRKWIKVRVSSVQFRSTVQTDHTSLSAIDTPTRSNSMRLKVVVLIEYINLTTDVIDQKANSSSIIALEGKTIAKWLCKVHSLGKQIWDPLKPWRLSSLSPTICGDCSKHLAGDLPRPVESQWETWQGARHRHKLPLHFNYTAPQWLAISLSPRLLYITIVPINTSDSPTCSRCATGLITPTILPATLNQDIFAAW